MIKVRFLFHISKIFVLTKKYFFGIKFQFSLLK